jgi:hypothetical protein
MGFETQKSHKLIRYMLNHIRQYQIGVHLERRGNQRSFWVDSGQLSLFNPKIGHKYLHLKTVVALLRVVVNLAGH